MKNTIQRIKEYIDYQGISVSFFEKKIGMSNGSFASQLKKNKTIGVDKLEKILNEYPEISAEWLLRGIGNMLKPNGKGMSQPILALNKSNKSMNLQERIHNLIDNKKVTPYEISIKTGISESTLGRILNGKTKKISIKNSELLANYFDVDIDWLNLGVVPQNKGIDCQHEDTNNNSNRQQYSETIDNLLNRLVSQSQKIGLLEAEAANFREQLAKKNTHGIYTIDEPRSCVG
ncbi:MAG: helix-turn-helix domain-containing protein [Prevotellaceae bacterium]|jgi:transcriptional regulator with XRE-family HTH domain|nr:helix-turn-helix domain-containing protein [Prevotellaceae bacterium]